MKNCVVCDIPISGNKKMYCSNACKQKHHYNRVKKQTNTYHSQTLRAYKRKLHLVELAGGQCSSCGYSKNIAALEFHHLNPDEKEGKLDMRNLSNRTMDFLLKEFSKCVLLCSNCHREVHHPEMEIESITLLVSNNEKK
jgi:hypothetical protein